tara:strand:- start:777 stop:1400 length:624 start_codon:yes stop_codon:yes gene_type:complete
MKRPPRVRIGFNSRTEVHGDTKYNRKKQKINTQREIENSLTKQKVEQNNSQLKNLYDKLNDPNHCEYKTNSEFHIIENNQIKSIAALELLKVFRYSPRECICIGCFEDNLDTRINYSVDDVNSMKDTIQRLRLPNSWPSNLGEKVFYHFRSHLEGKKSDPIYLEQKVVNGKERGFLFVLKKIIDIYQTDDLKDYIDEKGILSGGKFN